MATFIDLDSGERDNKTYPNPADYTLTPEQVDLWTAAARRVSALSRNANLNPADFAVSVNMKSLTIPYTVAMAIEPRVYVDFHSTKYNDTDLIQTIGGIHRTARFVCTFGGLQHNDGGAPVWIHYNCNMEQILRFSRRDPVVFRVTTRNETVLTNGDTTYPVAPDPTKQIMATFEITPYIRDNDYSNHMTGVNTL